MPSTLKILLSEVVVTSILFSNIIPISTFADEALPVNEVIVATGSSEELSSSISLEIENSPVVEVETTGAISISNETSVDIIQTNTGNEVLETLFETGVIIQSAEIIPMSVSETGEQSNDEIKTVRHKENVQQTEQILVQFHTDIENYVGQYQVDQIENEHQLDTTEIISGNLAVMELKDSGIPAIQSIDQNPTLDAEKKIDSVIDELKKDPRIAYVQKNHIYTLQSFNDPGFDNLWALHNQGQSVNGIMGMSGADIDYPEAMNFSNGKLNTGVVVAVIDSGIEPNHPELHDHLWNGQNCKTESGSNLGGCMYGYDFVDNDTDPTDDSKIEHGAHVAGTIGAMSNNAIGITGIVPNVSIMALRVCDDFGCSSKNILRAIQFAKQNGAKVINASLGGLQMVSNKSSDFDFITYNAIKEFPGLFIAAAGNDGINTDGMIRNYPSGFSSDLVISGEAIVNREIVYSGNTTIPGLENVISVGASNQNDQLSWFSNYGISTVDISAPGENIYSTIMEVSGEAVAIRYADGWKKQMTASGNHWERRTITSLTGETSGISSESLWGNTNTPYVSGESVYIEKSYTGITAKNPIIAIDAWCDTVTSYNWTDYLEVLVSTGGVYQSVEKIDEDTIDYSSDTFEYTWINGYKGKSGEIRIKTPFELGSSFDVRIKWKTATNGVDSNGLYHYGCSANAIKIMTEKYGYAYKSGTSMATPHVAGAAALAWSYRPTATISEVRDAIVWSGDYTEQIGEKIRSGYRLNINHMLHSLNTPIILSEKITPVRESTVAVQVETTEVNSVYIDYSTHSGAWDISNTGTVINYSTLFATASGGYSGTISGLSPDTTYYYHITGCGYITCTDYPNARSFHTPKVVSQNITTPVNSSGSVYLSGALSSGFTFSGSTGSGHIILTHSDNSVRVDLPTQNLNIISSGSWDGILNAPNTESGISTIVVNSNIVPVRSVYKIGSDTSSLNLSGQVATISITVSGISSGSIIPVYRADTVGSPYTQITTCIISNSTCTFTTNHFSLFAVGNPGGSTNGGGAVGSNASISNVSNGTAGPGGGSFGYYSSTQNSVSIYPTRPLADFRPSSVRILTPIAQGTIESGSITTLFSSLKKSSILSYLADLEYRKSETSLSILAQRMIIDPIQKNIQSHSASRGQALVMYDIALRALDTKIHTATYGSLEFSTLLEARTLLKSKRKAYIKTAFGY